MLSVGRQCGVSAVSSVSSGNRVIDFQISNSEGRTPASNSEHQIIWFVVCRTLI